MKQQLALIQRASRQGVKSLLANPREAGKHGWLWVLARCHGVHTPLRENQEWVAMQLKGWWYICGTLGSPDRRHSRAPQPKPTSSAVSGHRCTLSCLDKVNRDLPGTMAPLSFLSRMGRCRGRQQVGFRSISCDYCWGLGVRVTLGSLDGRMCPQRKLPWVFVWCLLICFVLFPAGVKKEDELPGRTTWELTFRGPEINCIGFRWRHSTNTSRASPSAKSCSGTVVFLVWSTTLKSGTQTVELKQTMGWVASLVLACRPGPSHRNERPGGWGDGSVCKVLTV